MQNFFSKEQGKRIKAKAESHPTEISKPHDFAGMLIWKAMQLSVEIKDVDKAKEQTVDWYCNASPEEIVGLLKGINVVAKKLGISVDSGKGYRILSNLSEHGGQEVPHLHFHLFGGERVGKMVE